MSTWSSRGTQASWLNVIPAVSRFDSKWRFRQDLCRRTASLFPNTEGLNELNRLVIANHVPQKDTWRISLTWPVINQAAEVAFEIEGPSKTDILAEVLTGPRDPERLPSQLIRPSNGKLLFLLDEAAAAKLPATSEVFTTPNGSRKVGTLEI